MISIRFPSLVRVQPTSREVWAAISFCVLQFHVSDFVERAHGQLGCVEIEQRDIKLVSAECAAIGETIESFVAKDFGNNLGRRITDVNGDNPAIIHIGDTYADLSATITGSQGDLNLGIKTFLNDRLVSNIVLDTTAMATDTIDYVTTDDAGLTSTSTSTRTVLIEAAAPTSGVQATSTTQ